MSKSELRPVCSLGMFDFFKGIAIVNVLIAHSRDLFTVTGAFVTPLIILYNVGNILMYAFVIAAGYGIRKRPMSDCLRQIKQYYLTPYLFATILAPLFLTIVHFLTYHSLSGAIGEGLHLLTGFLLGQYPTCYYFGWLTYTCGPLWFLIAISIGWFILNLLLNKTSEKVLPWAVGVVGLIGYVAGKLLMHFEISLPYCIPQSLVAVPALYLGYMAKKKHFFEKKPTPVIWIIFAAAVFIFGIKATEIHTYSGHEYPLGILSLAAMYILGVAALYLFTHINRRFNVVVNAFEKIGHATIDILVLHTIEYFGMLWYRVGEKYADQPLAGFLIVLCLRCLFIVAGLFIINLYRRNKDKIALKLKK